MAAKNKVRVAVNGYGVIGKRVAHAVTLQDDMTLTGIVDVVSDWRAQAAARIGMRLWSSPLGSRGAARCWSSISWTT